MNKVKKKRSTEVSNHKNLRFNKSVSKGKADDKKQNKKTYLSALRISKTPTIVNKANTKVIVASELCKFDLNISVLKSI